MLSAISFSVYSQNTVPRKINTKEKIGWIKFDSNTDNPDFYLCDENNIMEYYQVNPIYKEGFKSIYDYFDKNLNPFLFVKGLNGYITIKFVINCKGNTDRYRIFSINNEYLTVQFPKEITDTLLNLTSKMDAWTEGQYQGEKYDCYKHLTFKIRDGQLVDILP